MEVLLISEETPFARKDRLLLESVGHNVNYIVYPSRAKQFIWFLKNMRSVLSKAKKCDIIYTWWGSSLVPVLVGKLTRRPVVVIAGGGEVETDKQLSEIPNWITYNKYPWYAKWIVRRTLRNATKVVVVAENTLKNSYYKVNNKDNSCIIYNSVNANVFKPVDIKKKKLIVTTSYLDVGYIYKKGHLELMDAFVKIIDKFPDYKLIYVGTVQKGKESGVPLLVAHAKKLGIKDNIEIVKYPESKLEYVKLLNSCDLYVHYSNCDSFAVAMVEAMSCGLPVIVSDSMALPEVVGDAGIVVPKKNPFLLAKNMESILSCESLKQELSNKARKRVLDNYTDDERCMNLDGLLNDIYNKNGN